MEQQTTRHLRKSLEDFNVTLHEGRVRIVVNSAGFFIRETRMERFSVTSRTTSFSAASSAWRHLAPTVRMFPSRSSKVNVPSTVRADLLGKRG